jgi:hypothetical protein
MFAVIGMVRAYECQEKAQYDVKHFFDFLRVRKKAAGCRASGSGVLVVKKRLLPVLGRMGGDYGS